jgi:hypothetical protein
VAELHTTINVVTTIHYLGPQTNLQVCYNRIRSFVYLYDGCFLVIEYSDAEHQECNAELCRNDARPVSQVLRERRLSIDGHCMRSNQPIADILLCDCDHHLEKEKEDGMLIQMKET